MLKKSFEYDSVIEKGYRGLDHDPIWTREIKSENINNFHIIIMSPKLNPKCNMPGVYSITCI